MWAARLAAAPTIPRECRVEEGWAYQPGQFGTITAPTLLLQGSDSVPGIVEATERAAAAIPGARIQVLDGHGHFAHKTDAAMVTALIREFISEENPQPSPEWNPIDPVLAQVPAGRPLAQHLADPDHIR